MATLNSVQADAVAWKEIDGEFVLISVETTHYYSLNSTGSYVWRALLEGPLTNDSITELLAASHGVETETVRVEVTTLLDALATEGLIRVREGSEPTFPSAPAALDANRAYEPPCLVKYDALERLVLSGE